MEGQRGLVGAMARRLVLREGHQGHRLGLGHLLGLRRQVLGRLRGWGRHRGCRLGLGGRIVMEGWRGDGSLGGVYGGHGWRFFWRSRVYTIQRACIRFISQWWLSWGEGEGERGKGKGGVVCEDVDGRMDRWNG